MFVPQTTHAPSSRSPSPLERSPPSPARLTRSHALSLDTIESLSPAPAKPSAGLKTPSKTSKLLSLGLATGGLLAGYALGAFKKLDLVTKLAIGIGGALVFYSISFLPKNIERLKNSSERLWATLDIGTSVLTIVQKIISLVAYIPKIASNSSRVFAISISSSFLAFFNFVLSAVSSARTLLAFYDVKHLHDLNSITTETLSQFISNKTNLKWVLEEYTDHKANHLNRLIHENPEQAARWIKKVSKGALVFSALSTISQSLGAAAVVIGLVAGGIVGVPVLTASTGLFFCNLIAQNIATRLWLRQLT